ncbi:(R)-phenoxypropionate/alpha-ketoglutarate-dioxygenase [Halioglobus japonicus]|nr:(R)-phenoxypropionate/alpha-ketoglutarate-dioxygenase [Halioglobus japonicus]
MIEIVPSGQACGATVKGVDLSGPLDDATILAVRAAWLEHHVLAFPDQQLSRADLERLVLSFGAFGSEPFFLPMEGSEHIVALTRKADEKAPLFAENWHSDWSFLEEPPIGTCLYSLVIPPVGGNTGFANQQKALAEMPPALRARIEGRIALHSAGAAYAPDGMYGEKDKEAGRSMAIHFSEDARQVQKHPFIQRHPESGRETLLSSLGYIMGVEGMADDEALQLLLELYEWQTREEFQYTHIWQENMFVLWDNRSVLHRAYGGYDGYDRILHRVTVAADTDKFITPQAA